MKNNNFTNFIPPIISFALVVLFSSFVGFKALTVASIILCTLIIMEIVGSVFKRFIFKEKEPTKWYIFACIAGFVGAISLLITAQKPNNVTFWFTLLFLLAGFVFICIDEKFGLKEKTNE